MRLEGKAVVVTGASSGMGKAIVELFVKEGAKVVAVARRKERLEELAKSLEGCAGKVLPFPGDLMKEETAEAAMTAILMERYEEEILMQYQRHYHSGVKMAEALGVDQSTLSRKLRKYGLTGR